MAVLASRGLAALLVFDTAVDHIRPKCGARQLVRVQERDIQLICYFGLFFDGLGEGDLARVWNPARDPHYSDANWSDHLFAVTIETSSDGSKQACSDRDLT